MIAPFVQVQISVTEPGRQIQQGYSVSPLETLADLFARIAREHGLTGSQAEWVFHCNGQPQTWGSTVGEVIRYAGDPALLVLTLLRTRPKREEAEGAGGDWEEAEAAPPSPARPAPPSRAAAPGAPPAPATLPSVVGESRKEREDSFTLSDEDDLPSTSKRKRDASPGWKKGIGGISDELLPSPSRVPVFDVDDDLADDSGELQKLVSRQATVRYYHRMNPQRVYPFLVVLSAEEIAEIAQKGVKQAAGDRFEARTESPVEIEPVLPGCQCYPPRHTLVIGPETQTLEFWVVPQVLGEIKGAKVIVRQDGDTLSEVKLKAKVVKQTAAVIVGILSFVMPYVTKGLKSEDPDGTKVQTALNWVASNLRPEMIFAGLALVAVGLYFSARPRKRDQFWDVTPKV